MPLRSACRKKLTGKNCNVVVNITDGRCLLRYVQRTPDIVFRRLKGKLLRLRIITLRPFRKTSIKSAAPYCWHPNCPILYALSSKDT
jgi:hypothetical protein